MSDCRKPCPDHTACEPIMGKAEIHIFPDQMAVVEKGAVGEAKVSFATWLVGHGEMAEGAGITLPEEAYEPGTQRHTLKESWRRVLQSGKVRALLVVDP
ncbi:hypothetical protein [Methylobacter sp.]|uniref:hypothetical protein n=1 Tax=Methylobacter sp. TaxID=2051955 RepID=UPI001223FA39|nr:hypothetical protein [Methylobacter sp.]TAK59495.1 MAG: hypothetical protein EPO18_20245 [Methylobacter sp.]